MLADTTEGSTIHEALCAWAYKYDVTHLDRSLREASAFNNSQAFEKLLTGWVADAALDLHEEYLTNSGDDTRRYAIENAFSLVCQALKEWRATPIEAAN